MRFYRLSIVLSSVMLILTGCGGGGGSSTSTDPVTPSADLEVNVTISGEYQVESLGTANTIKANVSVGETAKDLYLVLSNSAKTAGTSVITHNAKISEVSAKSVAYSGLIEQPTILHAPQHVQDFPSRIGNELIEDQIDKSYKEIILPSDRLEDIVNTQQLFYLTEDTSESTLATARYVSSPINTVYGTKTLNIWVSNDSFGIGCGKTKCVTPEMVDALAEQFLIDGLDNDIYDWVTNIYGEEWSSEAAAMYSYFISENNEITILLTDIDNDDSPNGGVIGFFYGKDNYISGVYNGGTYDLRGSNERVMFYIDSVMFANGNLTWSIDDYWPKETVSTLAHEFQHMINFYQNNVLLDINADTWIKEMLSESTEDIIATKLGHNIESRYPLFNVNNTLSLTDWNYVLEDYAKVNVFGAYLIRNYGGAELLHNIMHNTNENEEAVVHAVNNTNGLGKTFSELLAEWGVAVMLSDHDNLVDTPVYNIGALFDDAYGSTLYEMRSINLFNYNPIPATYISIDTVQAQGNYYYKIGEGLTGDINITLELNGETEATLIAK